MTRTPGPDAEFIALQEALAGRYSLERELGRGGMGVVYLAQDVRLDRQVALKLLPPTFAAQAALRERFMREARTAAGLSHPNIVPIHVVDEVGDFVFFVMAFVQGEPLGQRVRERGPVHPREAARILREVSWALAYAHGQGVVHRDIKPDNILLEAGSGRAMVTDFGIAQVAESAGLTSVGEVLGTPEYMSPEQAGGEAVDGRSDLYALAVVGHYMLSGTLPFQGETARATLAKQLTQPAPALASVAPEVPGPLAEAIDRCLEKDPSARLQGGEELAGALDRVLQDRKEVPVAIRVFEEQNRESTTGLVAILMVVFMWVAILTTLVYLGWQIAPEAIPFWLLGSAMLAMVPLSMVGIPARRLLKSGYGYDELVRALRSDIEDRRRALVSEVGQEPDTLEIWAPRVMGSGLLLMVATIVALALPWVPVGLIFPLMLVSSVLLMGGGLTAAVHHSLRKAVPGERWLSFWESFAGRAIFGIAGVGVDAAGGAAGSYLPTEIAIGMAADRLFQDLPKDVRRSLGQLPDVVDALEGHAETMRARLDELDRVLGDMGEQATLAGGTAGDVAGRRASLAAEVGAAREAAEERLSQVVAALESIRLELLRLHAGSGSVESMTQDLTAARELTRDVERLLEGRREVEQMLGHTTEERKPDTPVPA
jgi:serine/threonine-protein kinase